MMTEVVMTNFVLSEKSLGKIVECDTNIHEDKDLDVEGERVGGLVGNLDSRIRNCCLVWRGVRQRFSITLMQILDDIGYCVALKMLD